MVPVPSFPGDARGSHGRLPLQGIEEKYKV